MKRSSLFFGLREKEKSFSILTLGHWWKEFSSQGINVTKKDRHWTKNYNFEVSGGEAIYILIFVLINILVSMYPLQQMVSNLGQWYFKDIYYLHSSYILKLFDLCVTQALFELGIFYNSLHVYL